MIVVQVELWPLGSGEDRKVIAAMLIENCGLDESGTTYRYTGELHHKGDPALHISAGEQIVEIVGHDRRNPVWELIHTVLSTAVAQGGVRQPLIDNVDNQDDATR